MPAAMEKSYSPAAVEPRWRERWEELGIGVADPASARPTFVIALPPPNITGALHLGHAVQQSVQDVLCRYRRMRGDEVEWCPGTDHAAIATQNVIERQLADEGTTKETLGRARFQQRVDTWYRDYGGRILEQMRRLGFSCDWSRTRFTLDPAYVRAIRVVFKSLYDEGLIYRGPRIVNWCPRCLSAISDEEIDWQEHTDTLVSLRYPIEGGGSVVVATVRPETMLGDTGVAVSPGDPRYASLVGRTVVLPLSGRRVPIVADDAVQREFGTGALKVTPGHDATDYEIGQRHGLAVVGVIAADGTMNVPDLPQFHGLPVTQARTAVTAALRELGAVVEESEYVHDVGHCDRCGEVLEPLVSEQWWVRMKPLAQSGIALVERGELRFHPARFADTYLDWMRNIRDWCISRQLWLGHAIPVSTCANGHRFAWLEEPTACQVCADQTLTADPDVLDTWFSSALWPFAIFGWPKDTAELRRFYPTDVLVTGREIIFLWVARMVMTGLRFTADKPFSEVIINSTIQAADGSRMSKSKGNTVDPLDMIERYGADAVRAWAGAVGTAGQDMRFDENRIASYRYFANKLWNATRLLTTRLGGTGTEGTIAPIDEPARETLRCEDRWFLSKLAETTESCDTAISQYRFHDAMERLYDTTWHVFCDHYVEMVKRRLSDEAAGSASRHAAAWTATTGLDVLLRLLHPFMPFVTEECAQRLPGAQATLQRRPWPTAPAWWRDAGAEVEAIDALLEVAARVRAARHEAQVPPAVQLPLTVAAMPGLPSGEVRRLLEALLRVSVVDAPPLGTRPLAVVARGVEAALHLGELAPAAQPADTARLEKQRADRARHVDELRRKLTTPGFIAGAPPAVVEGARRRLEDAERELAALERLLPVSAGEELG